MGLFDKKEKDIEPIKSLYTARDLISLREKIKVLDETDRVVYEVKSKIFSMMNKIQITDAKGRVIAQIEKPPVSVHEMMKVKMADGTKFDVSNEFFHLVKQVMKIKGLGWKLKGNIAELDFRLVDQDGKLLADINQRLLSLRNKYSIDIYQPEDEEKIVAILIALQTMILERGRDVPKKS